MKHLTVRGVPEPLARALAAETRRRGQSLTQTVKDLLAQALGLGRETSFDNGLARFAGGWTDEDLARFEKATAAFEQIDEEVWRPASRRRR
jgi:plasmid stability protein